METFDEEAESEGRKPPRKGEGETREQGEKVEGYYMRVTVSGAAPAEERAPEEIPRCVHDRNAVRRGETALRHGQALEPGIGSKGFGKICLSIFRFLGFPLLFPFGLK